MESSNKTSFVPFNQCSDFSMAPFDSRLATTPSTNPFTPETSVQMTTVETNENCHFYAMPNHFQPKTTDHFMYQNPMMAPSNNFWDPWSQVQWGPSGGATWNARGAHCAASGLSPWTFGQFAPASDNNNFHPTPEPRYSNPVDVSSKRKPRNVFSTEQLSRLHARFAESNTIHVAERRQLAAEIGLRQEQIKTWFQNRRYYLKTKGKKAEEGGGEGM